MILRYLHVHGHDFATIFASLFLHQREKDGVCWDPGICYPPPSTHHPKEHIGQSALGLKIHKNRTHKGKYTHTHTLNHAKY